MLADINIEPGCSKATDPDMVSSCSRDPEVTMTPGSIMRHLELYGPGYSVAPGHQHGLRWKIRFQKSTWPLVAIGATDIDSDPGCRATNSDTALSSSLGLQSTITLGWQQKPPRLSDAYMAISGSPDTGHPVAFSGNMWYRRIVCILSITL